MSYLEGDSLLKEIERSLENHQRYSNFEEDEFEDDGQGKVRDEEAELYN